MLHFIELFRLDSSLQTGEAFILNLDDVSTIEKIYDFEGNEFSHVGCIITLKSNLNVLQVSEHYEEILDLIKLTLNK